jgi:hypothetical protein
MRFIAEKTYLYCSAANSCTAGSRKVVETSLKRHVETVTAWPGLPPNPLRYGSFGDEAPLT